MIKIFFILLVSWIGVNPLFSQNLSFELTDKVAGFPYIAYVGFENPMNVIIENLSCNSVFLTSDNGPITRDSVNGCRYYLLQMISN